MKVDPASSPRGDLRHLPLFLGARPRSPQDEDDLEGVVVMSRGLAA